MKKIIVSNYRETDFNGFINTDFFVDLRILIGSGNCPLIIDLKDVSYLHCLIRMIYNPTFELFEKNDPIHFISFDGDLRNSLVSQLMPLRSKFLSSSVL